MRRLTDHGFQGASKIDSVGDLRDALLADPFLDYAYEFWSTHAKESLNIASAAARLSEFVTGCHSFPALNRTAPFDLLGPLHVAAVYNFSIAMASFNGSQDPNANTAKRGYTPLCLACSYDSSDVVQELLSLPDIQVNATGKDWDLNMALILAIRAGHSTCVSLLLRHPDIEVNLADRRGYTPLITAAFYFHHSTEAILQLLLSHPKVQVNTLTADAAGWTALGAAAQAGYVGKVKLILARPDLLVNAVDWKGMSTLMNLLAARNTVHNGDTIRLILEHPEVDVNIVNRFGETALMLAARNGHEEMVKQLLARGDVKRDVRDHFGRTALIWAIGKGHESIAQLLRDQVP